MTPCCSVWALLKGPAHPQAAMPPSHGAEGTHGRGEAESYSYSYSPSSEGSEEERSEEQRQGIGEKRQRAHKSAVSESSMAESSCSEGMEEERKAPTARELISGEG